MSDATHSPGPWQAGDRWSKEHVYAADGEMVADCCRGTRERGQANARLIAAAPDLLAACEAFVGRYDYLAGLWGEEGVSRGLADRVRAAIHKAVSC